MIIPSPWHTDRSRIEAGWTCGLRRYYGYDFQGRGITPIGEAMSYYTFGSIQHAGLETLARRYGEEADVIGDVIQEARREAITKSEMAGLANGVETANLASGLLYGFWLHVWPRLMRDYDIVAIEPECWVDLGDDIRFMSRPDLVLRHKVTGEYVYYEYKTTASVDPKWVSGWTSAVQVHAGLSAASTSLQLSINACIILGLFKGYRDRKYGDQRSIFTYGKRYAGTPGVVPVQYTFDMRTRGKGWEQFPVHEYPGGTAAWVQGLPEEILSKQYVETPPILVRRDMVDKFLLGTRRRERTLRTFRAECIANGTETPNENVLGRVYEAHYNQCTPTWGDPCPFRQVCWQPWVAKDPVGSGLYTWRTPHHTPELTQLTPAPNKDIRPLVNDTPQEAPDVDR